MLLKLAKNVIVNVMLYYSLLYKFASCVKTWPHYFNEHKI